MRILRPSEREAWGLVGPLALWSPPAPAPEPVQTLVVDLAPGKWCETPVPAWAQVVLWVDQGLCLPNPDGEEPDVVAGTGCLYRQRNRDSAVFLVAGPGGCQGRLLLAPGSPGDAVI